MKLLLYSDGGSRGNPGPAAFAFLVCSIDGNVLRQGAKFLGVMTNNEAEYLGLLAALQVARQMEGDEVIVTMDSELVVKQVRGEYRMKAANLAPLLEEVRKLSQEFRSFQIRHVRREDPMISRADALVNQELDICTRGVR